MTPLQIRFLFLNLGHFVTHFLMLVFATVAALRLNLEWGMSYAELIPYATPGFIAYGLLALPSGWLADKWSREGMMTVFFIGIGLSSIFTGMADSVVGLTLGLTLIGSFAAIYHPVGLALVVQGRDRLGLPLALNGVFGNMGVAFAALVSGYLIDQFDWRSAFLAPGAVTVLLGLLYFAFGRARDPSALTLPTQTPAAESAVPLARNIVRRVFAVILLTTALGGLIFQSTTFALPKVLDERLAEFAGGATEIGAYTFLVFAIAGFAQLVVGYLVDRYPLRTVFLWVVILQILLFAVMIELSGLAALLVSIGFMLVVFGEIPINDVLVGRIAKGEWRSRAFAVSYLVGFSVSASSLPLIGWIHGLWGFGMLFGLLSVVALMIFCVVLFLPETRSVRAA